MKDKTEFPDGQKTPVEPDRGFISAPTLKDLKPTPREVALLEELWDWQERSERTVRLLPPLP